jgi:hypothetical protein
MKSTLKGGRVPGLLAGAVAAILAAGLARGGEHAYPIRSEKYKAECGACHVAYPPQLLGAAGWKGVMDGLARHFGTDASLDARTVREIGEYLDANAARRSKGGGDGLRISETRWFRHEHGEELSPAVWTHPKVKSAANCEACHTQASLGDYGERTLRVPR